MINKITILSLIILLFNNNLKSQITLVSSRNTPKPETLYIYQKVDFDFSKAVHGGCDTVWDFSDLTYQTDTNVRYFTRNPNYNPFPGMPYTVPPLDSSYLRSDTAIYRVTDTLFYQSHIKYNIVEPGSGAFVAVTTLPVLRFPLSFNSIIYEHNNSEHPYNIKILKKTDAYGSLVTPDSTYSNLLRVNTYDFYSRYITHGAKGYEIKTYEWYAENSELPLMSVQFRRVFTFSMGYESSTYDTMACVFKSKLSDPFSFNMGNDGNVNVYPNPASNYIKIRAKEPIKNIEIVDALGIVKLAIDDLSDSDTAFLNLSFLANGFYFIKIKLDGGSVFCRKFLIERE